MRWGYIFRAVVVIMEPLADTLSFCILRHSTTFICIFLTKRTFLLLVLMAIRNTHWGDTTMEVSIYLPSEEGREKDIYAVARILNISTPARAWVEVVNFPIFIYSFKEYIYMESFVSSLSEECRTCRHHGAVFYIDIYSTIHSIDIYIYSR